MLAVGTLKIGMDYLVSGSPHCLRVLNLNLVIPTGPTDGPVPDDRDKGRPLRHGRCQKVKLV